MHIRAPPAATLYRYKHAYQDVGDDDDDGDSGSESDDDDDGISCTVADDTIGSKNNRPFWGKCYQSRVDTLGMYNDDSDDDDDVNDDWRVQIVDSYINHVQEPFISSSVEQTASLTESDESSGESFGDGHSDIISSKFHQPQQNIATGDPIADTMTRIMNAGMGISTSYESILPIITEQQQILEVTEQQKRKAIIAVITGQQHQQQSNTNVRSSSSSSSSSVPLKKRQRQERSPIQQQREQEGEEKDQQQQQLLPVASLTIYPDIKQTELALQQEQQNMNKKKPPPLPKSPQDSMLFDDVKWNSRLIEATKFVEEHKHGRIPTTYASNPDLASWAKRQRYQYKVFRKQQTQNSTKDEVNKRGKLIKEIRCQMTPERHKALEDIGFCWDLQKGLWDSRYEELRKYAKENKGNASPSKYDHYELWKWIGTQRFQMTLWKRGKTTYLTPDRIFKLNEIGFVWDNDNSNPNPNGGGIPTPGTMPENDSQGPYFI